MVGSLGTCLPCGLSGGQPLLNRGSLSFHCSLHVSQEDGIAKGSNILPSQHLDLTNDSLDGKPAWTSH